MLELSEVDAFYGDSHILHGISLRVQAGERISVVGRNGAGKSTLLKSIMNAGTSVRGTIKWEGVDLSRMRGYGRARLGIAFVPEDRRIYAHLTVLENLALARRGENRSAAMVEARALLASTPLLADLGDRLGDQLSGGQQQMLAVMRGIAARPKLILLDEPTEGLAPLIVENMARDIVARCDAAGIGLLLCEQNIWFARKCTHRLYIIDTGRLMFEGSWADFDAKPDVVTRFLAV